MNKDEEIATLKAKLFKANRKNRELEEELSAVMSATAEICAVCILREACERRVYSKGGDDGQE